MLYKFTIWSYVKVSYILLREAYIANTRNESVTLGNSDKCNSFKFTYKAMSESYSPALTLDFVSSSMY